MKDSLTYMFLGGSPTTQPPWEAASRVDSGNCLSTAENNQTMAMLMCQNINRYSFTYIHRLFFKVFGTVCFVFTCLKNTI